MNIAAYCRVSTDKEGNVDICLRLLGDLGLDESVLAQLEDDIAPESTPDGEPFSFDMSVQ